MLIEICTEIGLKVSNTLSSSNECTHGHHQINLANNRGRAVYNCADHRGLFIQRWNLDNNENFKNSVPYTLTNITNTSNIYQIEIEQIKQVMDTSTSTINKKNNEQPKKPMKLENTWDLIKERQTALRRNLKMAFKQETCFKK